MKFREPFILVFIGLLSLSGCASSVSFRPFGTETYPPSEKVEVFTIEKPTRPYDVIGQIVVNEGLGGGQDMMNVAIAKARAIGAHAIILTGDTPETGFVMIGKIVHPASTERWVFLAVRWKKERP